MTTQHSSRHMPRFRPVAPAVGIVTMLVLCAAPAGHAQMDPATAADLQRDLGTLGSMQMVEPGPELPGDRAKSCMQLALEMRSVMEKRGFGANRVQAANAANCAARGRYAAAQRESAAITAEMGAKTMAALATAAPIPGAAEAAVRAAQAADIPRLEAAAKKSAQTGSEMASTVAGGAVPMMQAMNDPRMMRLFSLMEDKNCQDIPQPEEPAADPCTGEAIPDGAVPSDVASAHGVRMQNGLPVPGAAPAPGAKPTAAADDPFVHRAPAPKPAKAADDPFAR